MILNLAESAQTIFVTPEEKDALGLDLWLDPETGLYMADLSVFHDIHCLDFVRRNIPGYSSLDNITRMHFDHCFDGIRLSLMCAGDMTMIPVRWSERRGWILPVFDIDHTCRDYEGLKEWSLGRDASDPDRYPQVAAKINAERMRANAARRRNTP
ncbi:hypothetical protein B0T16DRAFT_324332 [Cercophora newfieldiana]|uniref:Uncharacterized protein n=1 Tax=Cercophora newfieldiana TaxID=92897 RepID=A0AA39Y8H6_9PEZI|nr:hypothetical protein B0T16DRAFT_324332 [Cercophora newfieldiana]